MLKGTKSISLSYNSVIGDEQALYLSTTIPTTGKSNTNVTIQDLELYEANKAECRADIAAFNQMVFDLEDGLKTQEGTADED